jgi:hypothetical protein
LKFALTCVAYALCAVRVPTCNIQYCVF